MPEPLHLACDEAGFTGPDLLNRDQRYFAFGSVAMDDNEASSSSSGCGMTIKPAQQDG